MNKKNNNVVDCERECHVNNNKREKRQETELAEQVFPVVRCVSCSTLEERSHSYLNLFFRGFINEPIYMLYNSYFSTHVVYKYSQTTKRQSKSGQCRFQFRAYPLVLLLSSWRTVHTETERSLHIDRTYIILALT